MILKLLKLSRVKVKDMRMDSPWLYVPVLVPVCMLSYYIYSRKRRKTDAKIVVFTRYPVPGSTKTRLIPALGQGGAAYAQRLMTDHIVRRLKNICCRCKNIGIDIWYNGGTQKDMSYWIKEKKEVGVPITLVEQPKGDLGYKLQTAAEQTFSVGNDYVIIIGCDIPGISESVITSAIDKLRSGSEMVLGPASDGGYYLVGFSRKAKKYLGSIFQDIDWGTEKVFKQQSEKAESLGVQLEVLPTTLSDVDLEEDIPVMVKELGITHQQLTKWSWSVVIPTLNEENNIESTLDMVEKKFSDPSCLREIIICDGGSHDNTIQKVEDFAANSEVKVKIVKCRPGRGFQLKAGTAEASGDHLFFFHSDSIPPNNYDVLATQCLSKPGNVAGAFKFSLDALHFPEKIDTSWFIFQLKTVAYWTNWRSKEIELPYGDSGIFMSRKMYDEVGGFDEVFLMEDVIIIEKLWHYGHIGIAEGEPMVTSARRWRKWGVFKITGMNNCIMMAYHLGVSPNKLAEVYYGKNKIKEYS